MFPLSSNHDAGSDATVCIPPSFPEDSYYGLLTNPPGLYGQARYGDSTAYTLRGSEDFRNKALNLFSSFSGDSTRTIKSRNATYRYSQPTIAVHAGPDPESCFFCLPTKRAKTALRLYFYGQLYAAKGVRHYTRDDDGDILDISITNEQALMDEASLLAESFHYHYIPLDYHTIITATSNSKQVLAQVVINGEHRMTLPRHEHQSE